mgnify:CR=1 FL=1
MSRRFLISNHVERVMRGFIKYVIFISSLSVGVLSAEESKEPSTDIERFQATTGDVIIKGMEEIGTTIRGKYKGKLTVEAREFIKVSAGDKSFGIVVEVKETSGSYPKTGRSFVDYDELDSLVDGIDYISNIDETASSLSSIEATYSTNGGVEVSAFTSRGKLAYAITAGTYPSLNIYLNSAMDLTTFKDSVIAAKVRIDSIK